VSVVALPGDLGLLEWVAGADHKTVARRMGASAGAFFVLGGLAALLMRSELARPGLQIASTQTYDELFTVHGTSMIYLVMVPAALALGVYLVPLQIGAADLVAPRLNLVASWLLPLGGLLVYAGFLTSHGAATAGWTEFLPLSDRGHSPGPGTDYWIAGVALAAAGAMVLAATVLATILVRRAPGMTMLRLPVMTWTVLATCLLVVFSFPALEVALGLLAADRHLDVNVDPVVYLHLFWFFGHPVVYVMFFPFVGAVAEVVAVFSSRRFVGYPALVLSLLAFTTGSMTVWAHHMFTTGQVTNQYFSITSTTLLVFAGVEYFDMTATMWRGSIRLATPMLFALGFLLQFVIGGVTGIIVASPPLDYHLNDSYFVVAHFHYTLFAGSLFGLFAGIYYWFPKATGRLLGEGLGKLHFWILLVGTNLTFFPMFLLGYDGMTRRVADYPAGAGLTGLNELSTAGAAIIALGMAVFLLNLVRSLLAGEPAGTDPWGGHTLEWATTSPPPRDNFPGALPPVRSYAPLLDLREAAG
jgi:cytochrome c oxidase subunit 1